MEHKTISKSLSEENNALKQYIETLNTECMDLQAALFEEANKMAQTAYASEHAALKRAELAEKENSVLKIEVEDLKNTLRLHLEENSPVVTARRSVSGANLTAEGLERERKRKDSRLRSLSFLRNSTSNLSPLPSPLRQTDQRRATLHTSSVKTTPQEPITRRYLLEALTSSTSCVETVGDGYFQEFLDWVDGGCYLRWHDEHDDFEEHSQRQKHSAVAITFANDTSSDSFHRKRNTSDVGDIRLPNTSAPPSSPLSPKGHVFFDRLMREDVLPALDFANTSLCAALRLALGHLGVEMEPLSSLALSSPAIAAAAAPHTLTCPLVPGEPVTFSLKFEAVEEDGATSVQCYKISSWARQRIAAVADLFQYLSLIRRGLTGTPTTPATRSPSESFLSSNRTSVVSSAFDLDSVVEPVRRHQFENVQRRRLAIALSRLGYGLPSME